MSKVFQSHHLDLIKRPRKKGNICSKGPLSKARNQKSPEKPKKRFLLDTLELTYAGADTWALFLARFCQKHNKGRSKPVPRQMWI